MTPREAATVLAVAATYDQRLSPPSREDAQVRAMAWAEALHPDMPVDFARRAVIQHYSDNVTVVMPAHLNQSWRAFRRAEVERVQHAQLMTPVESVPMPREIRERWRAIAGRKP